MDVEDRLGGCVDATICFRSLPMSVASSERILVKIVGFGINFVACAER